MSKRTKAGFLAILLIPALSFSAFAQMVELRELQNAASRFSSTIADSLPLNASLGLNWSDAYIGRVFPSIPPRFGVGVSAGFTTVELSDMDTLASHLGFTNIPNMDRLPFPGYTVEARIGGLFLPFDVGFKFGHLPSMGIDNFNVEYFLIGGDIRYAILDRRFLPTISIGIGFNYMRGSIGGRAGGVLQRFNFTDAAGGSHYFQIDSPNVNLNWSTHSLDFRLQISQSFFIVTPYLGLGVSHAWSRAGYEVRANVEHSFGSNEAAIREFLQREGLDGMDVSGSGISSDINNTSWGLRAFGGISLNMVVFRLDFTGLYSFLDGNYGASIGFRFQL